MLDQVKAPLASKHYDSFEQLADIIRFRYPRFTPAQADFVAHSWAMAESGRIHLLGDARHRWVNPILYRREEARLYGGGSKRRFCSYRAANPSSWNGLARTASMPLSMPYSGTS